MMDISIGAGFTTRGRWLGYFPVGGFSRTAGCIRSRVGGAFVLEKQIATIIVEAVKEITSAYLFMEIEAGPAINKPIDDTYRPPNSEATALIGLDGGLQGGIFLSAPEHMADYLASAMAGEELNNFDEMVRDAFGEIANMIAGGIQTNLSTELGAIELSPPSIISHGDAEATYQGYNRSVRQFFKTDSGPFFVEVFYT
ncbi:MAG: chemotaxis protein CheX [Magnetococcales bacterium]|nr:chemotaxis protein CheX [Magnetococcales bacterium]